MKKVAIAFVAILSLLSTGCSTLADARAAKGSGEYRFYDREYDVVWKATIDAIRESDLQLVSDSKEQGTILAQRGMTAFSYGENVAIFIESVRGRIRTRVEVVNKRALATNITAARWESRILDAVDSKLK